MTLSFDFSLVMTYAQTIITALWPVFGILIGFGLGFVILNLIYEKLVGGLSKLA
jgi:predicted permease